MTHLAKQVKAKGISIESRKIFGATNGQIALLKVMNTRISEGRPLTMEDVKDVYLEYVCNGVNFWDRDNRIYVLFYNIDEIKDAIKDKRYSTWDFPNTIRQWLKNNLGSMVLKNMLIAIPVIDISESKEIKDDS